MTESTLNSYLFNWLKFVVIYIYEMLIPEYSLVTRFHEGPISPCTGKVSYISEAHSISLTSKWDLQYASDKQDTSSTRNGYGPRGVNHRLMPTYMRERKITWHLLWLPLFRMVMVCWSVWCSLGESHYSMDKYYSTLSS